MKLKDIYNRITGKQAKEADNLYRHCGNTPLDVFIDVLVNKNFRRLIRWGGATDKQLYKAWEQLFSEYAELSETPQYKKMIGLSKEIGQLQSKIMTVNICIQVLNNRYSDAAVSALKRLGYSVYFDLNDKQKYQKALISVRKKVKAAELTLMQRTGQYDEMIAGVKEGKLTEDYFTEMLVELSKFMGYRLNASEITVTEFVTISNKRNKELELMAKQHGKKR